MNLNWRPCRCCIICSLKSLHRRFTHAYTHRTHMHTHMHTHARTHARTHTHVPQIANRNRKNTSVRVAHGCVWNTWNSKPAMPRLHSSSSAGNMLAMTPTSSRMLPGTFVRYVYAHLRSPSAALHHAGPTNTAMIQSMVRDCRIKHRCHTIQRCYV
jgi:hypothetical protein